MIFRAYKRAVELEPESACLWYDVGISYLYTAQVSSPAHPMLQVSSYTVLTQSVPVMSTSATECLQAALNVLTPNSVGLI